MSSMYEEEQNMVLRVARLEKKYIKQLQHNSIKRGQVRVAGIQAERQEKTTQALTFVNQRQLSRTGKNALEKSNNIPRNNFSPSKRSCAPEKGTGR